MPKPEKTRVVKITFKKVAGEEGDLLVFKVDRAQWDTCIDIVELLCEANVELKLEVSGGRGDLKGIRQVRE